MTSSEVLLQGGEPARRARLHGAAGHPEGRGDLRLAQLRPVRSTSTSRGAGAVCSIASTTSRCSSVSSTARSAAGRPPGSACEVPARHPRAGEAATGTVHHRRPQVARGRGRVDGVPAPLEADERVLDDVLGQRGVVDQQHGQAEQPQPLRPVEVDQGAVPLRPDRRSTLPPPPLPRLSTDLHLASAHWGDADVGAQVVRTAREFRSTGRGAVSRGAPPGRPGSRGRSSLVVGVGRERRRRAPTRSPSPRR